MTSEVWSLICLRYGHGLVIRRYWQVDSQSPLPAEKYSLLSRPYTKHTTPLKVNVQMILLKHVVLPHLTQARQLSIWAIFKQKAYAGMCISTCVCVVHKLLVTAGSKSPMSKQGYDTTTLSFRVILPCRRPIVFVA